MKTGGNELVHEAVVRYSNACDTLLCHVAESHPETERRSGGFSGRMKEFTEDCRKMQRIMEEYETYLKEE